MENSLSIIITSSFETNIRKFKQSIYSLFDLETNAFKLIDEEYRKDIISKYFDEKYLPINLIQKNQIISPIEFIIVIDGIDDEDLNSELNKTKLEIKKTLHRFISYNNLTIKFIDCEDYIREANLRNIGIDKSKFKHICFGNVNNIHCNINSLLELNKQLNENYVGVSTNYNNFADSSIWNKDYLIKHNLYFPSEISINNSIWESNLQTKILETENRIYQTDNSLICIPNNSDITIRESIKLTGDFKEFLFSNQTSLNNCERVFQSFINTDNRDIILTKSKINSISSTCCLGGGLNIINHLCYKYYDSLIESQQQFIYYCSQLFQNKFYEFSKLNTEEKQECLKLFCYYSSVYDLYELSKNISKKTKQNVFEILNDLWRCEIKYYRYISETEQIQNFVYKYLVLKYIKNKELFRIKNLFDDEEKALILVITELFSNLKKDITITDLILFIEEQDKTIIFKNIYDKTQITKIKKLSEYLFNMMTEKSRKTTTLTQIQKLIDEFNKEIDLLTTTIEDNKNPISVLLIFLLSPNLTIRSFNEKYKLETINHKDCKTKIYGLRIKK